MDEFISSVCQGFYEITDSVIALANLDLKEVDSHETVLASLESDKELKKTWGLFWKATKERDDLISEHEAKHSSGEKECDCKNFANQMALLGEKNNIINNIFWFCVFSRYPKLQGKRVTLKKDFQIVEELEEKCQYVHKS